MLVAGICETCYAIAPHLICHGNANQRIDANDYAADDSGSDDDDDGYDDGDDYRRERERRGKQLTVVVLPQWPWQVPAR